MPNGDGREDCPHEDTNVVLDQGYLEERCTMCGKLLDRWKADKDKPMDPGPA